MNENDKPNERDPSPAEASSPPAPSDAHDDRPAVQAAPPAPPKYIKASRLSIVLMLGVATIGILLILRAWNLWPFTSPVVKTENAYVRGQITVLAPQVSGYVTRVLVKDFDYVKAGQPLVEVDNRTYAAAVAQAEAQGANARAQLANATQSQAQNRASLGATEANLASTQAELARANAELARVEELADKGSVSLSERDRVRTTARLAAANVRKAEADIIISRERIKATSVGRGGLEAQVRMAEAQLAQARINLANTVIRAPADGQISEISVRLGQYVTAGSQLLYVVPRALWVVANFKETQTARMHVGQPARFTVDALDGAPFTGRIEQLAPATGSEFSVLRPDNATGNFTKVVQRLPVRIRIDPGQPMVARLRPGMSVEVSVDTSGGR